MSIPKTKQLTLKRIVEGIQAGTIPNNGFGPEIKKLSPPQARRLNELAATFENFGECIKNEEEIVNSAKGLSELVELASQHALNDCAEAFQRNIVDKDMKDLKKRVLEHTKIAKECYARMQQLGVSYQDIGHILGRYYNLKKAKSMDQAYTTPKDGQSSNQNVMNETEKSTCAWCKGPLPSQHGSICQNCKSKFESQH